MTIDELKNILKACYPQVDDELIDEFIYESNFEDYVNAELNKITYEVWDKETPINDVKADVIKREYPFMKEAYIVKYDGQTLFFQYCKPYIEGNVPIEPDEVDIVASKHCHKFAEEVALSKYIEDAGKFFNQTQ